MTLHTRIATEQPFDVLELREWVNSELLRIKPTPEQLDDSENTVFDDEHFESTRTGEKDERGVEIAERRWIPDGTRTCGNRPGIGADAWFWIDYRPDGGWLNSKPLYFDSDGDDTEDPQQADQDGSSPHTPAMCMEINFDTTYSYQGPGGCGGLHAMMVARIGKWLDDRNVEWTWYNEFRSEWFKAHENLESLGKQGLAAEEWFTSTVLPAIAIAWS